MRAISRLISASVGALLWDTGCLAAHSDACWSRGQGRGSCGCDMWNRVMCSNSGGLQKTSVPGLGRQHAPQSLGYVLHQLSVLHDCHPHKARGLLDEGE